MALHKLPVVSGAMGVLASSMAEYLMISTGNNGYLVTQISRFDGMKAITQISAKAWPRNVSGARLLTRVLVFRKSGEVGACFRIFNHCDGAEFEQV